MLNWLHKRLYDAVNYRLRTLAGGRFASRCRPTSIALLFTERCNARCVHCDIWRNRGKEESAGPEQWRRVLEDLRRWLGPVHVVFTGGEALLRPFTVDLVEHASAAGLFVEVLTHGYWVDQARIERLALARPWRVTVSLDGLGPVHSRIRGREDFFERTSASIETLKRLRRERGLSYQIRLKTVLMEHNLDELDRVAQFATQDGMHVFYQPVEQNYNTPEDPEWFLKSPNWPRDAGRAAGAVQRLIALKRQGLHIDNSYEQLQAMIPYFHSPAELRRATQAHSAHERRRLCSALVTMELRANGDVGTCALKPPVGNIRQAPIREIWERRPQWWNAGCCMEDATSLSPAEHAAGER